MSTISTKLLQQRVRNRIIEYFDDASTFEGAAQLGAFETINQWEDWMPNGWDPKFIASPVFSEPEQQAIRAFCSLWDKTADATEKDLFEAEEIRHLSHWVKFVETAKSNYSLFMRRGRYSEEVEEF